MQTHAVIDFMSCVRQIPAASKPQTFRDIITSVFDIGNNDRVEMSHIVFDSYAESQSKKVKEPGELL